MHITPKAICPLIYIPQRYFYQNVNMVHVFEKKKFTMGVPAMVQYPRVYDQSGSMGGKIVIGLDENGTTKHRHARRQDHD